jgi:hypothetical protein
MTPRSYSLKILIAEAAKMSKKIITNNKPNGRPAIPISFPPYVNTLYQPSSPKARGFLTLLREGSAL